MAANHRLQGNINAPRQGTKDARVAKTHESHYSQGADGKRYNLVSSDDEGK